MKLAVISDEISPCFTTAVELGTDWGIKNYEIRGLPSGRIPYVSEKDLEDVFKTIDEYGINISAISPGVFKIPLDSEKVNLQIDDTLPRAYELARKLGTNRVIIFGFSKPKGKQGSYPKKAVEILQKVAEQAAENGIELALENEPGCWANTGESALKMIKEVEKENFKLNWDPCNSKNSGGKPYPEEYEKLKNLIVHLHIKDTLYQKGQRQIVPPGEGIVDWQGQLKALQKDGYKGYYTVETHFRPKVKASQKSVENLKRLLLEVV